MTGPQPQSPQPSPQELQGGVEIFPGKMQVKCTCEKSEKAQTRQFETITVVVNPVILQAVGQKVDSQADGVQQGFRCIHCGKVQMLSKFVELLKKPIEDAKKEAGKSPIETP